MLSGHKSRERSRSRSRERKITSPRHSSEKAEILSIKDVLSDNPREPIINDSHIQTVREISSSIQLNREFEHELYQKLEQLQDSRPSLLSRYSKSKPRVNTKVGHVSDDQPLSSIKTLPHVIKFEQQFLQYPPGFKNFMDSVGLKMANSQMRTVPTSNFLGQFKINIKNPSICQRWQLSINRQMIQFVFIAMMFIFSNNPIPFELLRNANSVLAIISVTSHGDKTQLQEEENERNCLKTLIPNNYIIKLNTSLPGTAASYKSAIDTRLPPEQPQDAFLYRIEKTADFLKRIEDLETSSKQIIEGLPDIVRQMQIKYGDYLAEQYNLDKDETKAQEDSLASSLFVKPTGFFNCTLTNMSINCSNRKYIFTDDNEEEVQLPSSTKPTLYNTSSSGSLVIKLYVRYLEQDQEILSLYLKFSPDGSFSFSDTTIIIPHCHLSDLIFCVRMFLDQISYLNNDYNLISIPTIYLVQDGTCGQYSTYENCVTCSSKCSLGTECASSILALGKRKTKKKNKKRKNKRTKNKN